MKKTNIGLVEHMKKGLKNKNGYVWGTFGQVLTEALLTAKIAQYPKEVGGKASVIRKQWMGRVVTDCVGAIKQYLWLDNSVLIYDGKTDYNANTMLTAAKEKGTIDTMPDIPGLAVQKQGHIGVYIGNGQVIEANSTIKGWIQTPLKGVGSTKWTHWLKVPGVEYVAEKPSKPVAPPKVDVDQMVKNLKMASLITDDVLWKKYLKGEVPIKPEHLASLCSNMINSFK